MPARDCPTTKRERELISGRLALKGFFEPAVFWIRVEKKKVEQVELEEEVAGLEPITGRYD